MRRRPKRPGTYTKQAMLRIARDLTREPNSRHPWIDARRSKFLRLALLLETDARPRELNLAQRGAVREAHLATTRKWRQVVKVLDAIAALPNPELRSSARALKSACLPDGLSFTQTESESQIARSKRALAAFAKADVPALLRDAGIEHALHGVAAAVARHEDALANAGPDKIPKDQLRMCNSALHDYARLVEECAGIELSEQEARRLLGQLEGGAIAACSE